MEGANGKHSGYDMTFLAFLKAWKVEELYYQGRRSNIRERESEGS